MTNRWLGSINHISITVSDLDAAMNFFEPWLDFLGYRHHERGHNSGTRLTINLNVEAGIAFNIWEAKGDLGRHKFEVYEPGLHHVALNADSHKRVDEMAALVTRLGGTILDGPRRVPIWDRWILRRLFSWSRWDEVRVRSHARDGRYVSSGLRI